MWEDYSQAQNLTYSFTGQVDSGKMQFPSNGCVAELNIVNDDNSLTNISINEDIPDENLSNALSRVQHIHTHVIHPYVYCLAKFLFANHQAMHDNNNHWFKFDNLLSVNLEAFTQGFQTSLLSPTVLSTGININWNYNREFNQYGWPIKRDMKSDLEVLVASYFCRLSRYINPLCETSKISVIQSFLAGFYVGKVFLNNDDIKLQEYFDTMRIAIDKVYMMPDNGYQIDNHLTDCRRYRITLSFPAILIQKDFEALDYNQLQNALTKASSQAKPLFDTLMNAIMEGNEIGRKGGCYIRD